MFNTFMLALSGVIPQTLPEKLQKPFCYTYTFLAGVAIGMMIF